MGPFAIGMEDVAAAAGRIVGAVRRTPLLPLPDGSWLKPESLQVAGSFKIRGAYNALAAQRDEARKAGVVADSSGNHAQAIAAAGAILGIRATVVMPENAAPVKVARTAAQGVDIVRSPNGVEARTAVAREIAERTGAIYVSAFDDPLVMAGQGTIGIEIAEDLADLEAVLVPVGGGGLISGVATAVRALAPGCRIVGVEPSLAADALASLRTGRREVWAVEDVVRTVADGARAQALGERTFPIVRALVDEIVTVDEAAIEDAVRFAANELRLVLEPTGALTLAALRSIGIGGRGVVAVASGGNIDPTALARLVSA